MPDLAVNGIAAGPLWDEIALRVAVALVGGLFVIGIYKGTRPATHVNPTFPPTLLLLAVLIAIVTQVIGNNVARAFSLVGALSIVRFRTIVRDTQDTAFVIFAVVIGMAAGAGSFAIVLIGLVAGGISAAIVRAKTETTWADTESSLLVRVSLGADPSVLLTPTFQKHLQASEVTGVVTARQGAAIEYSYRVRMKPDFHPAAFVKELNQLDGVQAVELRREENNSF